MIRYKFTQISLLLIFCLLSACSLLSAPTPAPIQLTIPPTVVPEIVLLPTDVVVSAEIPPSPTTAPTEAIAQVAPTSTLEPTTAATDVPTPLPTLTATAIPATETPEPTATPTEAATLAPTEAATNEPATATAPPEPTSTTIPTEPTTAPTALPTVEQVVTTPESTPIPPIITPAEAGDQPITVSFAPGAISTRLEGQLLLSGTRTYHVRALEGQQLFIFLDATNDTPNFSFFGLEDGMPYKTVSNEDRRHVMLLPSTQDYRIMVRSIAETYFWLDLVILPPGVTMPESAQEIIPWMATLLQAGHSQQTLEAILRATGQWGEFTAPFSPDFIGTNTQDDIWFATVLDGNTDNLRGSGDLGIFSAEGNLLFQYSTLYGKDAFRSAPKLHYPLDLTGDGRIDPLLVHDTCGAHTCYQNYDVLTEDGSGGFRPISPIYSETDPVQTISNSFSEMANLPGDPFTLLSLHGGGVGSVGAGLHQRLWTDTWQYDPAVDSMLLISTVLDSSNYRFHLLHDANAAWAQSNFGDATAAYLRVIQDESLEDDIGFYLPEENTRDSTKQFAAFRMMLHSLQQNDGATAQSWRDWLSSGEFNSASQIPAGATAFWQSYEVDNPGDIVRACNAAVVVMDSAEYPLGAVGYLGYQLPSLGAEDVCPILQ